MDKWLTWKDLLALGHPFSRQYTRRLEKAGKHPRRRRFQRKVIWSYSEYMAWRESWQPA